MVCNHLRTRNLFTPFFALVITLVLSLLPTTPASALSITSSPSEHAYVHERWDYNITFSNEADWRGNLTVTSTLGSSLVVLDWNLSYLPTEDSIGMYLVNVTVHDEVGGVDVYAYQNFTLEVSTEGDSSYVWVALAIGFGLVFIGLVETRLLFLAGISWLYISLAVLFFFGVPWMLIGLTFGIILTLIGGIEMSKGGSS